MAGWRQIPLSAVVVHGISPIRKLCVLRFRMPFSVTVVFLRCSVSVRQTFRTAVYGPVRTVVWQGSVGDHRPYADGCGGRWKRATETSNRARRWKRRIQPRSFLRASRASARPYQSARSSVSTDSTFYVFMMRLEGLIIESEVDSSGPGRPQFLTSPQEPRLFR